eukprot:338290-Amphidinium_carterae.1
MHGELADKDAPAISYLELKLDQIEDGELLPESLQVVMCRQETAAEPYGINSLQGKVMPDGSLRLKKSKVESTLPSTPEELRQKLKLMMHMWEVVKIRCPGKAFVQSPSFELWRSYAEWLLGEEVYACVVRGQ